MWYNITAILAIAMGSYIYVENNASGLTPHQALQIIAGVGGGTVVLLWNNVSYIFSVIRKTHMTTIKDLSNLIPDTNYVEKTIKVKSEGQCPPSNYEVYDNTSLIHIRNRLRKAGNQEGVELCTKLASIMFQLDDEEDSNAKNKVSV